MRMFAVLLTLGALASPATADQFTSPEDLISTMYDASYLGIPFRRIDAYFSARLSKELDGMGLDTEILHQLGLDPAQRDGDEVGLMTVFNLETAEKEDGLTAVTIATFRQNDIEVRITYDLIREPGDGWQIDHISGSAGELTWCTGELVATARALKAR